MKISIQLALAFSLLIVPLIANADVLLDDFETGTHSQFTTGLDGNFYDTDIPLPGAAGPLRLIQHAFLIPDDVFTSVDSRVENGGLVIEFEEPNFAPVTLIHGVYGGLSQGVPPSGFGDIEGSQLQPISPLLDLSQETCLRLRYSFQGKGIVVVTFYAFGGPTIDQSVFDETSNNLQTLESGVDNEIVFPLSSLFNNVDPSQVNSIGFQLAVLLDADVTIHRFEATGGPTSTTVPADSFTVFRGFTLNAALSDFANSDDVAANFNPGFTLTGDEAPVWLIFDGNLASASSFEVESSAGTPGLTYTAEAFNWTTGAYEVIGTQDESFNSDAVFEFPIAATHVDTDGSVRSRVGWRQTGFTLNFPWSVSVDQISWSN